MTLHLRPTDGRTANEFLEQHGQHIYKHSVPHETWNRCGADRLPVIVFKYDEHEVAQVPCDVDDLMQIFLRSPEREIYLVKIVDLIPHVERLEARLKERLRREQTRKRIGRFAIPFDDIERQTTFARAILDKVFIVRAEAQLYAKEVSYIAYSDMFEEIQLGMKAPDYLWTAMRADNGRIIGLKADRMDSSAPSILETVLKRKGEPA